MQTYQIEQYASPHGKRPFDLWLFSLDKQTQSRITNRLDRMAQGNLGDHRHLEKGLYEARFHFGPGYRVYFGIHQDRVILLVGGGDKSSQIEDIFAALGLWSQFKMEDE